MNRLVLWLLERRYRLVILAIAFAPAPFLSFLATALLTLETFYRGARQGLASALAGTVGVAGLAWGWGADPRDFGLIGGATLLTGVGLGALMRWAGSLALAFQGAVLLSASCVVVGLLLWPQPGPAITSFVSQGAELLREAGAAENQITAVVQGWELLFVGLITTGVFLQLMVSLLLGYWMATLTREDVQFAQQFRDLRLGRVLGIPATLLMAVSLVLDARAVQNLFPLALFGFWFQGISVVHAWGWAKQWNPVIVAAMYILLLPPFTALGILGLASVGLVDNWIDLRAPLRASTSRE